MGEIKFEIVNIEKPSDEINVIIGGTHFIKSAEDIYEAVMNCVPSIKFALAFNEASADRLVRVEGTDEELKEYAAKNAMKIGAGHTFILMLRNAYPINVLNALKNVPEITHIMAASANPLQVIVAETEQGRGIIGIIDGKPPVGIENEEKRRERMEFLSKIGYKLK